MTLALYARRKQWPLTGVTVRLAHSKVHADGLRRVRDEGGQAGPDRARDHARGRPRRRAARAAAGDRRAMPGAPHAGVRDPHHEPSRPARVVIASARMYSWSPSLAAAWHRLLGWVAGRAGVPMTVMDHADPMPLDELWARPDLGCAFMCGYPVGAGRRQAAISRRAHPLARALRRPCRVRDRLHREGRRAAQDARRHLGGRIAYSTEHSHSGYNAPRFHLLRLPHTRARDVYREVIGPFVRQVPCLDAVVRPRDVAAIDGYGYDLLARTAPDVASRVRVVETSPAPSRRSSPRPASTTPRASA